MTYNVFSGREDVQSVLDSILAQDADLVVLLELNPLIAAAVRAWVAPADGYSDHHPLIAEFVLAPDD